MKKALLSLVLASTFLFGAAQNFEGVIIYQNTYKSKLANIADVQWSEMLGSRQEYFIKGGEYKSVVNGSLAQWQVYIKGENKLYSKLAISDTVYWNDGSENRDEVMAAEIYKDAAEILGIKCDALILTCKSGKQTYYFSEKYKIDSTLFQNYKFGNWYAYVSRSGALPLKVIIDNAQMVRESVATEIRSMPIESATFRLPAGTKTAKSRY